MSVFVIAFANVCVRARLCKFVRMCVLVSALARVCVCIGVHTYACVLGCTVVRA